MSQDTTSRSDVANEPLFRPEAMLAQQTQLHGTIRLMQPIAYTVWALGRIRGRSDLPVKVQSEQVIF